MKTKHFIRQQMETAIGENRNEPPACPHFGECGGCEFQDVPYAVQVEAKIATFRGLAQRAHLLEKLPFDSLEIVESPRQLRYRQRMDYVCAFGKYGLRKRRSHKWVVGLEECHLIGEKAFNAFQHAVALSEEYKIGCYNYIAHVGELRYIVVRQTRKQEVLLSLVTKTDTCAETIEKMATSILASGLAETVYWLHQPGLADLSFGEPIRFWGKETIEEEYHGRRFQVGPNTFFQANPAVAEVAYGELLSHIQAAAPAHLLDLYSGTGVIAMLAADMATTVEGVENIPDNLALASTNLQNNGIRNCTFHEADATAYLKELQTPPDYLVLNPPRAGVGEKACMRLLDLAPRGISYMSCNASTLLQDLDILLQKYDAVSMTLYDMFPQTHHWETIVRLVPRS